MSTLEFKPSLFRVGVFGLSGRRNDKNEIEFPMNVRTDQERQRKAAGLPDDWKGVIVDLPGGTFQAGDMDFASCLKREVFEETGGCNCEVLGGESFLGPFMLIKPDTGTAEKPHDFAFIAPCQITGEMHPTSEASEHRWVTWRQLLDEEEIRLPAKGKEGRMAKMILACLDGFCWIFPRNETYENSEEAQQERRRELMNFEMACAF